ncbi:anti-sigma-K factor RskA [Luteibacter sp. OK325]|uniref:anti-sigma factor n=1 Tax=Luteibacter sp. OK325 TaxID=2135670 RepID=UPI000D366472|nr:anti-sigma factor [Luteibacter sp. OK325]PTR30049.1 anti-sigma-K factor RskA [Luteibacter sp. OK325]
MNSTFESDKDNLRYAEYALGLLDADARAAVAREVETNAEAAAAVALWQRHFTPLAMEITDVEPPAHVWAGIRRRLAFDAAAPSSSKGRESVWDSLGLWRWIGVGATALAACLLVITMTRPVAPPSAAHTSVLMVSTIAGENGVAGWTATMDIDRSELLVVPASPAAVAADRNTELWLIPAGGAPISVGVFPPGDPKRFHLDKALLDRLGPTAALAVSLEPLGGSPTGQPTGPVIAKGAIRAA